MEEFMQMLGELFKQMAGRNGKGEREEVNQAGSPEDSGAMPRIKRACASVLMGMKREIQVLEQVIAGLDARRNALIEEHNAMVAEIKAMEAEQCRQPKPAPEEEFHGASEQPEAPPAPETSPRVLLIRQGITRALAELDGIKNAGRSKALKKLREHLAKLAEKSSQPEELLLAELTSGIKQAVAMLDRTKMIVRARKLQHLRQTLAELLETASKEEAE